MNQERDKEEICKIRKSSGLNCNGCQYKESCTGEKVEHVLPEGMRPGTKQAKIYWELKSGKTAKEVIATKEFASESVYIVARKYFPDAIEKRGGVKPRVKKKAGKVIDKENYFGKSEIPEKAMVKAYLEKPETEKEIKAKEATMEFIEHYFDKKDPEPAPKIDERILKLEKMIKDGEKLQEKCKTITVILKDTKAALEEGKIIETYNKLQKMIEYMEVEK